MGQRGGFLRWPVVCGPCRMFGEISTSGAAPALEAAMRFASARQKVLSHNIANITTPDFRPSDVSVEGFQAQLKRAVDARRGRNRMGGLPIEDTREVQRDGWGGLRLLPQTPSRNVLFHDRNNRDLEVSMQGLVENASAFRVAADLLRSRYQTIAAAISERA